MSLSEFAPYRQLIERTREIALLNGTAAMLYWDQQTFMPPKALEFRAEQLSYLGGRSHRLFTASEVGDWLQACEDAGLATGADEAMAANVRGWRRHHDRATRLPAALVEEYERAKIMGNMAWMEARQAFGVFAVRAVSRKNLYPDSATCRPLGLRGHPLRRAPRRFRARRARGGPANVICYPAPGGGRAARPGVRTQRAGSAGPAGGPLPGRGTGSVQPRGGGGLGF